MNCTTCPYQKQIDALRRKCLACNPESDGGTPHGRVKADEFTLNSVPKAIDFDSSPSTRATHLAPEDEHIFRKGMASLFGLPLIEFMTVGLLMQGKTLEDVAREMDSVARQIIRSKGSGRQRIEEIKKRIVRKIPYLSSVLRTTRENDSVSRIIRELDND